MVEILSSDSIFLKTVWAQQDSEASAEYIQRPFEIRGHHLGNYSMLYRQYIKVLTQMKFEWFTRQETKKAAYTAMVYEVVEQQVKEELRGIGGRLFLYAEGKKLKFPRISGYAVGVLGDTQDDEDAYRDEKTNLYLNFLTLPDGFPVRIFTNDLDEICRLCRSGVALDDRRTGDSHCKDITEDCPNGDREWIEKFFGQNVSKGITISLGELKGIFLDRMPNIIRVE